ncbi:Apolipophorin [Pseudolycoriella hygida]|uniref:Apolipophorin n=1 Tax=Pseudolycoriella hygida TaxID=35572 RepID=A0A9Q0S5U9_9DIPT|nr:Apolipophorin [Pseudolycoriella hygida]
MGWPRLLLTDYILEVCNEGCPAGTQKTGKLAYKPGDMYQYEFKSDIKIYLSGKVNFKVLLNAVGTDTQEKTMAVSGVFQVFAQKNCNYAIKLVNMQVKGPDRTAIRTGADLQITKIVRFTLSNDQLSSEICAQADDTEFGLNVKRALISMLQSADYKSYETDVFGTCPTTFSQTQSGDTIIVTKTRDLNQCGHRESLATGLITSIFDDNAGVKSTPLLNGNYVSEQKFRKGVLENVQLTEDYNYVPFSNGQAGAKVKITTSVRKVSEQTAKFPDAAAGVPRTLLFENPKPQPIPKFGATIEKVLKATLESYHGHVGDNSAAKFSELIRIMQFAKKDDLTQLFSKVKAGTVDSNKSLTRKIYLDALFRTGTSDALDATVALINEFNGEELKIAYMSFNLVKNVNKESLPSIAKLLDSKTPYPKEVYLSLGSLLNKFCRKHGCTATETKNIFDKFTRKLNQCKANTHDDETTIVAVLKGIRNTQHLSPPIINQLIQCTGEKKSTRIRVAALETFTAAACDTSIQNAALALLKNRDEDSEIRIEAYLAYVACPSGTVANEIKKLLDTEPIYQVGSYITSHLASLRSTTDPTRQAAKQHFANVRSNQKFPSDFRKYSFNREFSYNIGSLGLGASMDTSTIFSQNSFFPRSTRFNLTGEIFGNSFNIIELYGRQENLDLMLENRFGPKGLFTTANVKELYDLFADKKEKRSVRNDIKQFAKTVKMGHDSHSDIELDVSFKLFGSEMYFMSLGDNLSADPRQFIKDVKTKIRESITSAKNFAYTYENHALFLDAELVYPTGVGMPLKLSALGTGVVKLETAGKLDLGAIAEDRKNAKFNFKLIPSYNFEIKSSLTVDGFGATSGLQVTGNVHSSTGFSVDFKMVNDGKGFDFDVHFPVTRQEIFKFDHKIVFVLQERGKEKIETPVKFTTKSNTFNGCFDQLNDYLGMTVCTDYNFATPQPGGASFPLNGENTIHAYANLDAHYKFQARITEQSDTANAIEFKFDTPGSKVNRQSSLKKVTSNTKLFSGSTELGSYDVNVDRDEKNVNGIVKIKVKDTLDGEGSFKSTNGKGDGSVLINLSKIDRKVKMTTSFHILAPTFDMNTDVYYNFEKENDKKITFSTKNRVTGTSFDSKNTVEVQGEKYTFNSEGSRTGRMIDGKSNLKYQLTLPNGRELSGAFDRDTRLDQDISNGKMQISLKDLLPTKKTRTLLVTGTLTDSNLRTGIFDLVHKITYTDFDGRDLVLASQFKHVPKGEFKSGLAELNLRGTLLPEVLDFKISADEYCKEHAIYSASAKYGGQFNYNINGNYYVGGGTKPTTYDVKTVINIPNTDIKSINFQSNGKFVAPETETDPYDAQFKVSGTLNNKVFAIDSTVKGNNKSGSGNLNINVPDMEPFSTHGSYTSNIGDADSDIKGNFNLNYGKGKTFAITTDSKVAGGGNDVDISIGLKTPFEQGKNVDFSFKQVSAVNLNTMRAEMKADDKKYTLATVTSFTATNPKIDVVFTSTGQPDARFMFELNNLGDAKYNSKLNLENFGEFNFASSVDGSFQSVENYHFVFDIDSPKIHINKIHGELNSKKSGKGIEMKITENGKNLISGNADFTVQDQNGKMEIGGQGDVKFYDKQTTGNFKFVRTNFDEKQHKETGFKVVLNGNVDNRKLVAEYKWTNKNLHIQNSICQDNAKCSSIQVSSSMDRNDFDYKHNLMVAVDLGSFGFTKDFLLTSNTEGSGFYMKHHSLDAQVKSKNAVQYQFKVDVKPTDSSAVLSLPTRQVVLEYVYRVPKEMFGKYDIRASFYSDKKNLPNNVASFGIDGNVNRMGNNGVRAEYALKFSHPTIRELKVSGKGEISGDDMYANGELIIDVFKNANQAIVVVSKYNNLESDPTKAFNVSSEFSITSKGFGLDYGFSGHAAASFDRRRVSIGGSLRSPIPNAESSVYFGTSGDSFELLVTVFKERILQVDGTYEPRTHASKVMATLKYLNSPPFIFDASVNGYTSIKGTFKRDRLIDVKGEVTMDKEASLHVTGQQKELFRGKVSLDPVHFLESEYKVNDVQIKDFVKNADAELRKNVESSQKEFERRFNEIRDGLETQVSKLKDAVPDFTRFADTYKAEGQKVLDDLKGDENIKKLIEFYDRFYGTIGKSLEEIATTVSQYIQKVSETLSKFYSDLWTSFKDKILPAIKDTYTNLERVLIAFGEEAVRFIADFIERTAEKLKMFEGDFAKLGVTVSEQFKKIAAFVNQYLDTLRKEINDFYQIILDNLKTLPGWEDIKKRAKETFGQYISTEQISQAVKAVSTFLQEIIPLEQLNEFVVNVEQYIENKLNKKAVNDIDELKKIGVSFLKAVREIAAAIRLQFGDADLTTKDGNSWFPIPLSFDAFKRIPVVSRIQFSPWNYFRHENLQSLRDIFFTYRPYAWNPSNFLPPFDKHGSIVDGQHLFTFDGRHLTFPGTCQYILAQDFVANNFSVVAHLNAGKLKAITLVDRENSIEVSPGGIVKLNDKTTELPVHHGDIHAWRRYYTVSFLTRYGVFIQCGLDLRVCQITINGYYHGKMRGALGNGNGEPYDDFTLPNGKVAKNFALFGNAYKTTPSCADVPFDEHKDDKKSEECATIFGSDSSLKHCYYFVDKRNYLEACEHAVNHASDKNDAACNIALAYASACRMENIFINAPSKCFQCAGKRAIGDKYTETAPKKEANVVFVVDLALGSQTLTELVQPSINILRNQLKMRSFPEANVHISVIGYRDDLLYPHQFSTNGKLDFTGKLAMPDDTYMVRDEAPESTGHQQIDEGLRRAFELDRKVKEDLGFAADGRAFQHAVKYPFSSTAGRAIIAFRSDALTHSKNPTKQLGGALMNTLTKRNGIAVHMIGPIEDLKLNNEKNGKLVGFNSDSVLILGRSKATDQRSKLSYTSDLGVDLVQANKGYVFSLKNFNETKEKKAFIQQMTGAVADDLARTEYKFECECELRFGLFAHEKCHQIESKTLPPIVKARG